MLSELLFELGTEELPSAAVKLLGDALFTHIKKELQNRKLMPEFLETEQQPICLATPRRLAIQLQIKTKEPNQSIERQGPTYRAGMDEHGQPTPALLGFARSCRVEVQALEIKETEKGRWWVYKQEVAGRDIKQLLPDLIHEAITLLPLQKTMRWGDGEYAFARPVHWAVLLVDDQLIDMNILGCQTGRLSYGHRFHHPEAIEISHAREYSERLRAAQVIVNFAERRQAVEHEIQRAAQSIHGIASIPEALLDEVTSIVEWPVGLCVPFDKAFLQNVPHEALIAAMHVHQKCFPVYQKSQLMSYFIAVSNIQSKEQSSVVQGNERVMRARLSDAAFFYAQDKQQSLSAYVEKTKSVVFQEKLGSLYDKSMRVIRLMLYLMKVLQLNAHDAEHAAFLSKADLMTSMVNEFPELEGLMGYYYALHSKESEAVAQALKEQYYPRFSGDALPSTLLGQALSLADRIDTLVGIFAAGLKPSATKDPFKLRRHAMAVIRILKELSTQTPLYLSALLHEAAAGYTQFTIDAGQLIALREFILDRLPAVYADASAGLMSAVLARQDDCLFDFDQRFNALNTFFKREESQALSAASKRVERLLQASQFQGEEFLVDKRYLELDIEKMLLEHIEMLEVKVQDYLSPQVMPTIHEYDMILTMLADFRQTVDDFFEQVMVMVDDPVLRKNRLHLLSRLNKLFQCVGDISKLY